MLGVSTVRICYMRRNPKNVIIYMGPLMGVSTVKICYMRQNPYHKKNKKYYNKNFDI
jgi:hypothetical protein